MNDNFNKVEDSFFLHNIRIVPNTLTRSFNIECDNIHLHHNSLDLDIDIPNEKVECLDAIIINGIKFIKEY